MRYWGSISRWLKRVRNDSTKRSLRQCRNHRRRNGFEALETRTLLATLTVNSLADNTTPGDGLVTLREAIHASNANIATDLGQVGSAGLDTIVFEPSLFAGGSASIVLTMGVLQIRDSLTIVGPGNHLLTIDANQQSRIMNIPAGTPIDVSLEGLSLTGGRTTASGDRGGGIRFEPSGSLTLNSVNVSGNSTAGDRAYGAAIFARFADVTLAGSTISGNSTEGNNARGGGIAASYGAVTLTDSTVSGNSTTGQAAIGGGIYAQYGAVTLSGSTVAGNSTQGDNGRGGGIKARFGAVTLTDSVVSGNRTEGHHSRGGGISADAGAVTLTNSVVLDNSTAGQYSRGGGISATFNAVTLTRSTVSGNRTDGDSSSGGGIFASTGAVTLVESTLSGNRTTGNFARGGAVFVNFGDLTVNASTVSGNSTAGLTGHGGGLRTYSGAMYLTGSTISGNRTMGSDSDGGGLWFNDALVTIVNSTITGNSATRAGGGLAIQVDSNDKKLTIHNSIIAGNTASLNPDFTAPNNPASNLAVRHSLIGDRTGTLIETASVNDDNLLDIDWTTVLASHTVNGSIVPLLADNGGAVQTVALLPNTDIATNPAIDTGDNSLAKDSGGNTLTTDARGLPRVTDGDGDGVAVVDMGAFEAAAIIASLDFGDAPTIYPVTLAQDGARHVIGDLFLGSSVNASIDGTPSDNADADDDDDGVFLLTTLMTTTVATTSSVLVIASGPGKLDAWIDFNGDGDWLDPGEQIFASTNVVAGENLLSFTIPAGATNGDTIARFRLSTAGGLAPTGAADDGEVEDYSVTIVDGAPDATVKVDTAPGMTTLIVQDDTLIVKHGEMMLFRAPLESFGQLNLNGSLLDDVVQIAIDETLSTKTLVFDGGAGRDTLELVESGQTFDLINGLVTLRNVEAIDIRGTGDNMLVLSIDSIKAASSTTDTMTVVSDAGDTIVFGPGWQAEMPRFINGQFTHVISEAATGGTARVEVQNGRLFQNPLNRFDVDRNGLIEPLDALQVLNSMVRLGMGQIPVPTNDNEISTFYPDVSGDDQLVPLDALLILNAITEFHRGGVPEGEMISPPSDFNSSPSQSATQREVIDTAVAQFNSCDHVAIFGSAIETRANAVDVDDWMQEFEAEGKEAEDQNPLLKIS